MLTISLLLQEPNPELARIALVIGGIVAGVVLIAVAIYFLPVGLDTLAILRHGAQRARTLDKADAAAGEMAKSGARTLLAIFIALGVFGLVTILVAAGPLGETPLGQIVRSIVNIFLRAIFGIEI